MQELCEMMKTQCICEVGEEIADAVLTAIDTCRQDFEDHIGKKGCRAGICKKFMTYHILADKCIGFGTFYEPLCKRGTRLVSTVCRNVFSREVGGFRIFADSSI